MMAPIGSSLLCYFGHGETRPHYYKFLRPVWVPLATLLTQRLSLTICTVYYPGILPPATKGSETTEF